MVIGTRPNATRMENSDYVLDANIVMSLLIGGRAVTLNFLDQFNFYSPDLIINELDLYTDLIRKKTKFSDEQLSRYTLDLFRRLTILPRLAIDEFVLKQAEQLCLGVDIKDTAYVALPLQFGFPLVTRDKPLHAGLRRKGFRNVLLFDEFLDSL